MPRSLHLRFSFQGACRTGPGVPQVWPGSPLGTVPCFQRNDPCCWRDSYWWEEIKSDTNQIIVFTEAGISLRSVARCWLSRCCRGATLLEQASAWQGGALLSFLLTFPLLHLRLNPASQQLPSLTFATSQPKKRWEHKKLYPCVWCGQSILIYTALVTTSRCGLRRGLCQLHRFEGTKL